MSPLTAQGDTLIVWRLDRPGRSVKDLVALINELRERGVEFVSLTEAIDTTISKAIELRPELAEAYNNRGITYGRKGLYDEAIADFSKAIELRPEVGRDLS